MPLDFTPEDLINALLVRYDVASIEDLRGKTPTAVRSLQRWKSKGWPENVQAALEMLIDAGLLVSAKTTARRRGQRSGWDDPDVARFLEELQELVASRPQPQ